MVRFEKHVLFAGKLKVIIAFISRNVKLHLIPFDTHKKYGRNGKKTRNEANIFWILVFFFVYCPLCSALFLFLYIYLANNKQSKNLYIFNWLQVFSIWKKKWKKKYKFYLCLFVIVALVPIFRRVNRVF